MELLVVTSASDRDPATEALRRLLRRLHLGVVVDVSVVVLREGDAHFEWTRSCSRLLVVDHLRTWPAATAIERIAGSTAGGKLRGARLRQQLRALPRPHVLLVDGAESMSVAGRIGTHETTWWFRQRSTSDAPAPSRPDGERVEVVADEFVEDTPSATIRTGFGFDGTDARLAGLDTRRANRREELRISGRWVVAEGRNVDTAALSAALGATVTPVGELHRPTDSTAADGFITLDAASGTSAALRTAVFAGTPVLAVGQVRQQDLPWFDQIAATPEDSTAVSSFGELVRGIDASTRDRRMWDAYEKFDTERAAERYEVVLASRAPSGGRTQRRGR